MTYYLMHCEIPVSASGGYLDVDDGIELPGIESWSSGARFSEAIRGPLKFDAYAEGDSEDPPAEMLDGNVLLMSPRLVDALLAAGVDNMDRYEAVIRVVHSHRRYAYWAVNIVGTVAAVDLRKSEWSSEDDEPMFDTTIDSLVLRGDTPSRLLLFRLAENTSTIVVHERVRDVVLARGIDSLIFVLPKDWMVL